MKFQFILFLCASLYVANAVPSCCQKKMVNNINYYLVEPHMNDNPAQLGCKDECVYQAFEPLDGIFCFKETSGGFHAKCLDDDCAFPWDYDENGKYGPQNWGKYCQACNGQAQSPIDIKKKDTTVVKEAPPLNFEYKNLRADQMVVSNSEEHYWSKDSKGTRLHSRNFTNNGHTAQLDVHIDGDNNGILSGGPLGDTKYQILQLHFHWGPDDEQGSEHTLNGKKFPMEMHIVHWNLSLSNNSQEWLSKPGGLAVTGFFFDVTDDENEAMEPLVKVLDKIKDPYEVHSMTGSNFKIMDLINDVVKDAIYSTYSGSLTTPECNEVVNWINFIEPTLPISSKQLEKFRNLKDNNEKDIVDNFRPIQHLNGRDVKFYK